MSSDNKSVMTEVDIDWNNVEVVVESSFLSEIDDVITQFKIEYTIYEFRDKNNKPYYQRIIKLPFACKSSWGTTFPKEANIKQLLTSKLTQKYKDVLTRNYNNIAFKNELEKAFINQPNIMLSSEDYPNRLYHESKTKKINCVRIGNIWNEFKAPAQKTFAEAEIDLEKPQLLTWNKFVKLMVVDNCAYCGVSVKQINEIKLMTKRSRGYTLEVDQKNPYGNYTDANCVACCYWCNNAKTDEFTVKEFKPIAEGIYQSWKNRLAECGSKEEIKFPEEVYTDTSEKECI